MSDTTPEPIYTRSPGGLRYMPDIWDHTHTGAVAIHESPDPPGSIWLAATNTNTHLSAEAARELAQHILYLTSGPDR